MKKNQAGAAYNGKVAVLIICAAVLQAAEAFLPRIPVPGMKLGLANIVTLIALYDLGAAAALEVAVLRCLAAALFTGTLFSPGFLISLTASAASAIVMAGSLKLITAMRLKSISIVGVSILGAAAHNAAQVLAVYLFFIHNAAVFKLLPWLGLAGLAAGFITGVIAWKICAAGLKAGAVLKTARQPEKSVAGKAGPVIALSLAALFVVAAMFISAPVFFAGSATVIIMVAAAFKKTGKVLGPVFKGWIFIAAAFLTPLVFDEGGRVAFTAGPFVITAEALSAGAVYSARVALLLLASGLLSALSGRNFLEKGIQSIMGRFGPAAAPAARMAGIFAMAWANIPAYMDRATALAREEAGKAKPGFSGATDAAARVFIRLYKGN